MLATGAAAAKRPGGSVASGAEERLHQSVARLEQQLLETQRRGDLVEESRLCNNIAKQLERLGEFERALHFHHYDRQISQTAGDADGTLTALANMANVLSMCAASAPPSPA